MTIQISIKNENAEAVLEEAMRRISRAAQNDPQWESHETRGCYKAECGASENDMIPVLKELTAEYPELDISAYSSREIREEDDSAQWWRTTRIRTVHHPDGTAELDVDSNTYWF